jgi:hypothetical protein
MYRIFWIPDTYRLPYTVYVVPYAHIPYILYMVYGAIYSMYYDHIIRYVVLEIPYIVLRPYNTVYTAKI